MKPPPVVSCIIIFLNAAEFIEEAIRSVFAQSYGSWELLLIDDRPTDRSTRIARELEARPPERVRYFEHPGHQNRGISASRNRNKTCAWLVHRLAPPPMTGCPRGSNGEWR